jgi:stage II sporulation protein D
MVLTWDGDGVERLFCAYYSAVCGGVSQSASLFGAEGDIAPLAGGVACDYCSIAPGDTYRWGTVKLSRQEIGRRLTARYPDRFAPGAVRRVEVIERDRWGRVLRLRIVDAAGAEHEMLAERFRLAIGADDVRSTHFSVRSSGASTVFVEGRGFGHGLGACQWGLEGQARQGRRAGEMLRYYFPGATLTRVY